MTTTVTQCISWICLLALLCPPAIAVAVENVPSTSTSPNPASSAESAESLPATWEPMLVVTRNAQLFSGETRGPRLPPGTMLYVSVHKEEWWLVPRWNLWIHESHVRSLPAAIALFTEQIKTQPTGDLYHFRAIAESELGQTQQALADFEAAIAAGIHTSHVYLNRGLAWARAGDREKAVADFTRALELDPKYSQAYFNRGVLYSHGGQAAAALRDFNAAIELEPTYAEALNNRGVLFLDQGRLDEALADFNAALESRPRYPGALTNRAYIHQERGEFAAALQDYATAIRIAPDSPPTLNDLAWLLATCPDENLRHGPAAVQYASRACTLTRHQVPDYLDTLAAAAAECGDFDRAVATLQQALLLADESERAELAERLALYQQQQPYHEPAPKRAAGSSPATEPSSRPLGP